MKTILQLLIICVICINSNAQEVNKEYYDNGQLKSLGKGKNPNAPITLNPNQEPPAEGEWKFYYENGNLKSVGSYQSGKNEGLWKYYYENGNLKEEGNWVETEYLLTMKMGGSWKYYHENGNIKAVGSYSFHPIYGHKRQGIWKEHNQDGQLSQVLKYDENENLIEVKEYNVKTGTIQSEFRTNNNLYYWKTYYENGNIQEEGNINSKKTRVGTWKTYDEKGVLRLLGGYHNDLKEGEWTTYYDTGELYQTAFFKNDINNGPLKTYSKDGDLIQEGEFANSEYIGVWKNYENGVLKTKINYSNHGLNLDFSGFFDNGKIAEKGQVINNKKEGVWKNYFENGNIAQEGKYINNIADGEWKIYHENGKISLTRQWKMGKLLNVYSCFDHKGNELDCGDFKDGNGTLNIYNKEGILEGKTKVVDGVVQE